MWKHGWRVGLALALFAPRAAGEEALTWSVYERVKSQVAPSRAELRFLAIPWRASLAAGMADARRLGRPLLLYVMNGHPLGCT